MTFPMSGSVIHASAVLLQEGAVLLLGPSGSGKSDLALRLIALGAKLIADDQTRLFRDDGTLFAAAPDAISGLLEMRGAGIIRIDAAPPSPVLLAVELRREVPRLPEPRMFALPAPLTGDGPPLIALDPFEASTPAKIMALTSAMARGSVVAGPSAPE
jgi:HPr kinase/phosphorylase